MVRQMIRKVTTIALIFLLGLFMVGTESSNACSPTPEAIEKWKAEGRWEMIQDQWRDSRAQGISMGAKHSPFKQRFHGSPLALGSDDAVDTLYGIVILVDFPDHPYTGGYAAEPAEFDSLLFSNRDTDVITNPTGSMTDFFLENSYGKLLVKGDIYGWYTMPQDYSTYVSDDNGLSGGRTVAKVAVEYAKMIGGADFSKYDNNNDGHCDAVIIVHAGPGAETGAYGIWSHQGSIWPEMRYDGVTISDFSMNPEEANQGGSMIPIGVFCHEFGHILGLPDLYDTNDTGSTSAGIGRWSTMASGNWNGNSRTPAQFDAWSKIGLGWVTPTTVTENMSQVEIPAAEYDPVVYKLTNFVSDASREYWLVENRQIMGFDGAIPGSGLCIYHIDENAPGNRNEGRYMVAVEQADGEDQLGFTANNFGDGGDLWPGNTNNRNFHDLSTPNSMTNFFGSQMEVTTEIGVWNISDNDSIMYADLDISFSRPWVEAVGDNAFVFDDSGPGGDDDGILDPGETIRFYASCRNLMRTAYNARVSLSTNRPEVSFVTSEADLATSFTASTATNFDPIEFTLAGAFVPVIDSFFVTITSDSLPGVPGSGEYSTTFGIEVDLGAPQILIVDDDRGDDYEGIYENTVHSMWIPHETWDKSSLGSPTGAELMQYPMVFWLTGDSTQNQFTSDDVAAMKQYMDNGGNLLMSTLSGASDLDALDGNVLGNYFGAALSDRILWPRFSGVAGNPVGDGIQLLYQAGAPNNQMQLLTAAGLGEEAFTLWGRTEICGVTYSGTHKSVLVTFPIEYLDEDRVGWDVPETFFARILNFFGGIPTDVEDNRAANVLPKSFELAQNYPNPFNPITRISYTIRASSGKMQHTNLAVYNMLGQHVTTLVDERQIPGNYTVEWDGTTETGTPVATGVYFYRLSHGDDAQTKKMLLVK